MDLSITGQVMPGRNGLEFWNRARQIRPEGSGGPLFNRQGQVIGINPAVIPPLPGGSLGFPIRPALELLRTRPPSEKLGLLPILRPVPAPAERIRVLVVDDDSVDRYYPRSILLQRFGAEVLEADSSVKALEILSQSPVDAIITDLRMPGMDGLQMLEFVRTDPKLAGTEIIVVSGYSHEQAVRRAMQMGASDFLTKPFDHATLFRKLTALFNRIELRRRARPAPEGRRSRLRILVADMDPHFGVFVSDALASRYWVRQATSDLEILGLTNAWNPNLLLLNPAVLHLDMATLLDQLWEQGLGRHRGVYLLTEEETDVSSLDPRLAGSVRRTLPADPFAAAVRGLLEPATVTRDTAAGWIRRIEPEMVTAVRQVFLLMTSLEAVPADVPAGLPADLFCSLPLRSSQTGLRLLLEIGCSRSWGENLARRFTGHAQTDLVDGTLRELLHLLGERLRESCLTRDLPLQVSRPVVTTRPTPLPDGSLFQWEKHFQWTAAGTFRLSLLGLQEGSSRP